MRCIRTHWVKWLAVTVVITSLFTGCPRRFDPEASPQLRANSSASPEHASSTEYFRKAQTLFEKGNLAAADARFERILTLDNSTEERPSQEIEIFSHLYRGRIALKRQENEKAYQLLSRLTQRELNPIDYARVNYFRGLAAIRTKRSREGRKLVRTFVEELASASRPGALLALAQAETDLGNYDAAVYCLIDVLRESNRTAERAYARQRIHHIFNRYLSETAIASYLRTSPSGSVLRKISAEHLMRIDPNARARYGLTEREDLVDTRPQTVLILVPESGRFRPLSDIVVRGATIASAALKSSTPVDSELAPLALLIRDSATNPARAINNAAKNTNLVAVVGTFDTKRVSESARAAAEHGLPFLCLAPNARKLSTYPLFQLMPDNAARARRLAHALLERHPYARSVILAPANSFGRKAGKTFRQALIEGGGKVVSELSYDPQQTTFSDVLQKTKTTAFDAVFVPDSSARLALIAPALAAAGYWSSNRSSSRTIRIVAMADGLTPRILSVTKRYLQGALLAPGYYASSSGQAPRALISRYLKQNGQKAPGLVEALSHDAIFSLRQHLRRISRRRRTLEPGASDPKRDQIRTTTKQALLTALAQQSARGLTGPVYFLASGERATTPLLYEVQGDNLVLVPKTTTSARAHQPQHAQLIDLL